MHSPLPPLLLASSSIHRQNLLQRLGIPFLVNAPEIDERRLDNEPPETYVCRLAESKARAVADRHKGAVIIGSDQAAVLNGEVIGKPGDHNTAVQQLLNAAGKRVEFLTAVCVLDTRTGTCHTDSVPFHVYFRELDLDTIERYLAREPAYDSAGSFHSEALGITLFEAMEGTDPTALVGLPLIKLCQRLREVGFPLP